MTDPILCEECQREFIPRRDGILTCSPECSHERHLRKNRESMRVNRYDYAAAGELREFLAPLDALVRMQPRGERIAGWWR